MLRYFINLSYKGTCYNGWQAQPNTPNTIQQIIQDKLGLLSSHNIELVGCGRTDAGVHALHYTAHFDILQLNLEPDDVVYKLNKMLPDDVAIHSILKVMPEAHARFDALTRTYQYFIHFNKNAFNHTTSCLMYSKLNINLMNEAAQYIVTKADYTSFSKKNTQTLNNICDITFAKWTILNSNNWCFEITSNRFLYSMVRTIVGTLIDVGKQKITPRDFKHIIEAKDRNKAGMAITPCGLHLSNITYNNSIFIP